MKGRQTKKINRKRKVLKGGQSPPPSSADEIDFSTIQSKLTDFQQEANTLANWASQYQAKTLALNNETVMNEHRALANSLAGQANIMYNRAQALWRSMYGSPWVPPPSAAPAPL